MKNHRWIAQELRKDHAQITNKPHTSAHKHEKAPNRANAWLCLTNTRRKTTHNQRTVASELRMNRAWTAQRMRRRRWSCVHSPHIKLMRLRCLGIPVSTVAGSTSFLQVRQVLLFHLWQGHPKLYDANRTWVISELSVIHQYFISITCACLRILLEIHTPIYFFSVIFNDT